jgi:hypothetical protein
LRLFLIAVRAIIERRDLKGELQELHMFPKDGDYPGGEMPLLLSK